MIMGQLYKLIILMDEQGFIWPKNWGGGGGRNKRGMLDKWAALPQWPKGVGAVWGYAPSNAKHRKLRH